MISQTLSCKDLKAGHGHTKFNWLGKKLKFLILSLCTVLLWSNELKNLYFSPKHLASFQILFVSTAWYFGCFFKYFELFEPIFERYLASFEASVIWPQLQIILFISIKNFLCGNTFLMCRYSYFCLLTAFRASKPKNSKNWECSGAGGHFIYISMVLSTRAISTAN